MTYFPSSASSSQWARAYHTFLVTVVFFFFFICGVDATTPGTSKWPVSHVTGVAGAPSKLPCVVIHTRLEGDYPVLVLWYKDGNRLPFYSLDLREEGDQEEHVVGSEFKGRVEADMTGGYLTLKPLVASDEGNYRCRVDFTNSPTRSAFVNLTVYVVPSRLLIQNEDSRQVKAGVLGPLIEGDPLTLYCISTGGRPLPEVSWWRGNHLLANRSRVLGEDGRLLSTQEIGNGILMRMSKGMIVRHVRTELSIPVLSRDYARANLTCQAYNNNITEPVSTTITLDVYLKPSSVVIKNPGAPLVEGHETTIECIASGAYPSAVVSWEKTQAGKSKRLQATSRMVGATTTSSLKLVPTAEDHGAKLTCRAHNPNIPKKAIHKSTALQVTFAPRVTLRLGSNLGAEPITEAKDVYFECEVSCNPIFRSIVWHRNGVQVLHQKKAGILISGTNLVLQMVRRTSAGNYTCTATNALGNTTSNVVALAIRYLPVCVGGSQTVAVAEGEDVRLTCKVDAQPEDDLRFTWYFNNTLDTVEVERHRIQVRKGYSFLDYTPRSARDYGTLSCWATNLVGTQPDPCRFTVVEAGPPERVGNCLLVNLTVGTLEVECTPGNDGGLPQRFVARVYASPTHTLLVTLQEDSPRFHVGGLTPGQDYLITITAVNDKGSSEPEEIDAVRLKVAEKRMGDVSVAPVSPLVGVFLGLVGGFILLLLAGIFLTRARSNKCNCVNQRERANKKGGVAGGSSPDSPSRTHHGNVEDEEDGPDVLKTTNETAQLLEGQQCPEIIPPRRTSGYSHNKVTSQPETGGLTPNGAGGGGGGGGISVYMDCGSPHHLGHDESFV